MSTTYFAPVIRHGIRRDLPAVQRIERESFAEPWDESTFHDAFRTPSISLLVAEHRDQVIGFLFYQLTKTRLILNNLAVAPRVRRQYIGTQLLHRVMYRCVELRRKRIEAIVRDANLVGQQFLRAQGWRAVSCFSDSYLFQWTKR